MGATNHRERVFELDVLRFIAAVMVVFYHLTFREVDGEQLFPGMGLVARYGYLGVPLFFMISGFVILWTAEGRSPYQFVSSRFCRLYPMFWMCIAVTVVGHLLLSGNSYSLWQIVANMTMVAGYLGEPFVDGVYWTLQVELKFYFLLFLLLVFGQMKRVDLWMEIWLFACIVSWFVPALGTLTIHPYGPLFIAGAVLYRVRCDRLDMRRSIVLLICLFLSVYYAQSRVAGYIKGHDTTDIVIACVFVVLIYIVMTLVALRRFSFGESDLLFKLAMMTYPLYLIHSSLGKRMFDLLPTDRYLSLLIVVVAVSAICYGLIYLDSRCNRICRRALCR